MTVNSPIFPLPYNYAIPYILVIAVAIVMLTVAIVMLG